MIKDVFGKNHRGETVHRYLLTNSQGMEVAILSRGATIHSIRTPDRDGNLAEITLGCDTVAEYERSGAYFGAVAGRYANRICKGQLNIDDQEYQLACNNGDNHLHGGNSGFDDRIWKAKCSTEKHQSILELTYFSEHGEEGYPGNLQITVEYTLNDENELLIDYRAETDQTTVLNLTNHAYFNLRGHGCCREHRLQLKAAHFTPTDASSIPTGDIQSVKDTPMDFTEMKTIGKEIDADDLQLKQASGGYDHNWVIRTKSEKKKKPVLIARVEEEESGRTMEVLTTQPGVQFYTGNFLEGEPARKGKVYNKHDGFCLETQHFPDSPNQPEFPSTELMPGEEYHQQTIFKFGTM